MNFELDPGSKDLIDELLKDYSSPALLIYPKPHQEDSPKPELELMLMEFDLLTDFDKLDKFEPAGIPFPIYVDKQLQGRISDPLKIGAKRYPEGIGLVALN